MHTNFWDTVIAVPIIILITQILNIIENPQNFVPSVALITGLVISVFISHRHSLFSGVFMGWFYGYAAIGSYSSLKTTILSFRQTKNDTSNS
ncbi:hypothetical protein ACTOTM_23895 [Bacillus subtilis]|uniref:Uncharacterized protein n=1 Tax=Bacillus subtilis TaxID=1423 RepID=A0AC62A3D6_BACIU